MWDLGDTKQDRGRRLERATDMGDTEEISRKRVAGGLALGHLAAAYSFTAAALLLGVITDPAASQSRIPEAWWTVVKALAFAPFEAAIISILTFFLMLPASLLTAPFTYFAARHLQAGIVTALAVGAVIGAAEVGITRRLCCPPSVASSAHAGCGEMRPHASTPARQRVSSQRGS